MPRSSLGFHTMSLSLSLDYIEALRLIKDFVKYRDELKLIEIYQVIEKDTYKRYTPHFTSDGKLLSPLKLYIKYLNGDKGIKWLLHCDYRNGAYKSYIINVTINPKILSCTIDYITAATLYDMNIAIINFNYQTKQISPILKTFDCYELKRIDYCVNLDVGELAPGCRPEQIMNLIRRGNIPSSYEEWTKYDSTSHRTKSKPGSFYLINNSVNINCYSKYMQLQEHSCENRNNGYPPVPQSTLDAAQNIIRFEIQCKYHKTYALSHKTEKVEINELLSPFNCVKVVSNYYKRIISSGDWYTLQEAIHIVEEQHFNSQKEKRLVNALQIVNQCRSLAKAKASCQGYELAVFKRTLNELSSLNINPVTIPKEWGIKHIPNLLHTYFNQHLKEYYDLDTFGCDASVPQGYHEYVTIFNHSPI